MDNFRQPMNARDGMMINSALRAEVASKSLCDATGQTYRPLEIDPTLPTVQMQLRQAQAQRDMAYWHESTRYR